MFKFLILATGWLFIMPSYASDYYGNLYQECDDLNKELTSRIIRVTQSYCTPSGYDWPACLFKPQRNSLAHCDDHNLKTLNLFQNVITANKIDEGYYRAQSSTNDIHPICFLASTALGRQSWNNDEEKDLCKKPENNNPRPNYRYYHCDDSESDQKKEHMEFYQCNSSSDKLCLKKPYITPPNITTIPGRPPCSSQEYIHKITKTFNEVTNCFDFKTKKEKEMIFALLNHESRFLLNKIEQSRKEEKTFRCFGQIDSRFISTLNQYIYFGQESLIEEKKTL